MMEDAKQDSPAAIETAPERGLKGRRRRRRRRSRSPFWAIVLIGVGVVWLLANVDAIDEDNLSVLLRVWPVLLIGLGLNILLARGSRLPGFLVGTGTVGMLLTLVIIGPSIGLDLDSDGSGITLLGVRVNTDLDAEITQERFVAALDDAEVASVFLDLSIGETDVHALPGASQNLMEAEVGHFGDIDFATSGGRSASIRLGERAVLPIFGLFDLNGMSLSWDVGLNPAVPLDLSIDGGAGPVTLELETLQLTSLAMDGGAGPLDISLPATGARYEVDLDGGAGPVTLAVPDEAIFDLKYGGGFGPFSLVAGEDVELQIEGDNGAGPVSFELGAMADVAFEIDGGAGPIVFRLTPDAAVRLQVSDGGVGPVTARRDMMLVDDLADDDSDTGIWQTDDFASARHQVDIVITNVGVGPISVE